MTMYDCEDLEGQKKFRELRGLKCSHGKQGILIAQHFQKSGHPTAQCCQKLILCETGNKHIFQRDRVSASLQWIKKLLSAS